MENLAGQVGAEWKLVLLLVPVDRVGGADTSGTEPEHVFVPGTRQRLSRHSVISSLVAGKVRHVEVVDHLVDERHCPVAFVRILGLK